MRNALSYLMALLLVASCGCAVQKSKAPQISPGTANALNYATIVSQSQTDYEKFFSDVGAEAKAGDLTPAQVQALNGIGSKMRDALDGAGTLVKTYEATRDETTAAKIAAYLSDAAAAFAQLYEARTQMLAGKAKANP